MFTVCVSLNAILPTLPFAVENLTRRTDQVGLVTGALSAGAVALELQTAHLLHRWPVSRVLLAGFACATVAMVGFAIVESLWMFVVLGALFGIGFGIVVATTSAMVGELTPKHKRGEAFGAYGLAATLPLIGSPALGLLLISRFGLRSVFWAFSMTCLVGLIASSRIGNAQGHTAQRLEAGQGVLHGRFILLFAGLACFSFTYGGVVSFAAFVARGSGLASAAAFFVAAGLSRVVSRSASGPLLDRTSEGWLTVSALLAGAAGLAVLTVGGPWVVLAGALYGSGYGIAQTTAIVAMLHRVPRAAAAMVSGWWNFAVDGGIGIGALTLAPLAVFVGYKSMFLILAGILIAVVALRGIDDLLGVRNGASI